MRRAGVAVYVHLVWATWDRLPLLVGEIERRVHRAIAAKCVELGAEVVALGGVADHVHLLVALPATVALAAFVAFVGHVKGASSHFASHETLRADADGGFFKWQGAYGAVSVSPDALAEVSSYIAHQREHHASNALVADWENVPPR